MDRGFDVGSGSIAIGDSAMGLVMFELHLPLGRYRCNRGALRKATDNRSEEKAEARRSLLTIASPDVWIGGAPRLRIPNRAGREVTRTPIDRLPKDGAGWRRTRLRWTGKDGRGVIARLGAVAKGR
jgi:hypothetical protein